MLPQAGYSAQAHDSVLHRPGVSAVMAPELYALYEEAMALPASLPAAADDEREQGAVEQDNLGGYDAYPMDEEIPGDGAAAGPEVAHAAEEAGGAKGQAPAAGSARKSMRSPGLAQPLTAEGNEGGQSLADCKLKAAGCRPASASDTSQCNGCMQQGALAFHPLERLKHAGAHLALATGMPAAHVTGSPAACHGTRSHWTPVTGVCTAWL